MINIVIVLLIILTAFIYIGQMNNAEIHVAPIFGVVFGALYSFVEDEEGTEYTLQCCIGIISITVIWEKTDG